MAELALVFTFLAWFVLMDALARFDRVPDVAGELT
jgi:hypothetical protein